MTRFPSSTPAPGPKGVTLPTRVPTDWMVENGYASYCPGGVGVSCSPSDDRMVFHYVTGKAAPPNHPAGSEAAAQWDYRGKGNLAARAAQASALAATGFEEAIAA